MVGHPGVEVAVAQEVDPCGGVEGEAHRVLGFVAGDDGGDGLRGAGGVLDLDADDAFGGVVGTTYGMGEGLRAVRRFEKLAVVEVHVGREVCRGEHPADGRGELVVEQPFDVVDAVGEVKAHVDHVGKDHEQDGFGHGDGRGVTGEDLRELCAPFGEAPALLGEESTGVGHGNDWVVVAVGCAGGLEHRHHGHEDPLRVDDREVAVVIGEGGEEFAGEVTMDVPAPRGEFLEGPEERLDLWVAPGGPARRRRAVDGKDGPLLRVDEAQQEGDVGVDVGVHDTVGARWALRCGLHLDTARVGLQDDGLFGARAREGKQLPGKVEVPEVLSHGGEHTFGVLRRAPTRTLLDDPTRFRFDLVGFFSDEGAGFAGAETEGNRVGARPGGELGEPFGREPNAAEALEDRRGGRATEELHQEILVVVAMGDVGGLAGIAGVVEDRSDPVECGVEVLTETGFVVGVHGAGALGDGAGRSRRT